MKRLSFIILLATFFVSVLFGQEEFFDLDESFGEDESTVSVDFSGEIYTGIQSFWDDGFDSEMVFSTEARLELSVQSDNSEIVLRIAPDWVDSAEEEINLRDILDEVAVRYFLDFGYIEAGYMKVEWGKGDGLHAVDPINPLDQSEGFQTDFMDMKKSTPLIKMNFYTGMNSLLELVYAPLFEPTVLDQEGRWIPYNTSALPGTMKGDNRPDLSLANFQGGLRYTLTVGPADLGAMYYYGFLHDQGFDFQGSDVCLEYTRAHTFGLEGAMAHGPFTFRMEAGYCLTEDIDGDDPSLYNNKIVYLGGFDITIPGTELFFSSQILGDYTFKTDDLPGTDVDVITGYGEPAHSNTLVVSLEHTFFHEKLLTRLSGIIMLEAAGYYISPEVNWSLTDNLELNTTAGIYGGDEDDFSSLYMWENNDFVKMGLTYSF